MATSQITPGSGPEMVRVELEGFDIKSGSDVKLVKIGPFAPINDGAEFVTRLGGDSALILKYMNEALKSYLKDQLASDPAVGWQIEEENDETETLELKPFEGQLIDKEKAEKLKPAVIIFAKLLFKYKKWMVEGNKTDPIVIAANKKAKQESRDKALAALLQNPAMVEGLQSIE